VAWDISECKKIQWIQSHVNDYRLDAILQEHKPMKQCIPNQWNPRVIMQWCNVYMCMLPLTRIQSTHNKQRKSNMSHGLQLQLSPTLCKFYSKLVCVVMPNHILMKGETAGFIFSAIQNCSTTNLFLAWWALAIEYFSTCSNRIWMIIVLNVPHCRGAPLGVLHMQA
jgi:hypothetical protein